MKTKTKQKYPRFFRPSNGWNDGTLYLVFYTPYDKFGTYIMSDNSKALSCWYRIENIGPLQEIPIEEAALIS